MVTVLSIVLGALMVATTSMQRELGAQRRRSEATNALLAAENFLVGVLQGSGANPYRVTLPNVDPATATATAYTWFAGEAAVPAATQVRAYSDFSEPDRLVTGPFEDIRIWVDEPTRSLNAEWRTAAGQTSLSTTAVTSPIDSLRLSYYATTGEAVTNLDLLPSSLMVRVRVVTVVREAGRAIPIRRDRWILIRNP